jgi:hypothetical protein
VRRHCAARPARVAGKRCTHCGWHTGAGHGPSGTRLSELEALNTLVLDEADRMLDMGFFDDIATVTKQCPPGRQTLLFSATYPEGIEKLARQFMREPVQLRVESASTVSLIEQRFYEVTRATGWRWRPAAQPLSPHQHAGVLQYQAAVQRFGCLFTTAGLSARWRFMANWSSASAIRCWRSSPTAAPRCWWPPM